MHIEFSTADGVLLKGQLIAADNPKAGVLLNPGTATKTGFYIPFARFLAEHGYSVMLWNYRDFCESRQGTLKGRTTVFSDIGRRDIPAAIDHACMLFGDLPLYCVAHSAGGQQLGFAANCNEISGMVALGVSTGFYGGMPTGYRLKAKFFFKLFTPISHALFGYVRSSAFRLMEDLPTGLAREWGDWCSRENFLFDSAVVARSQQQPYYHSYEFPVRVLTADDDLISTTFNTETLWKHIQTSEPVQFNWYKATETELGEIGHFGYFRRSHRAIWEDILGHLESFSAATGNCPACSSGR